MKKGISKDGSVIVIIKNGNTYRFKVREKTNMFLGYGYEVRTPDFVVTINENKYACFWGDGKIIPLGYAGKEYDGACYIEK